jgi:putative addiction module CopG family antidote
MAEAVEAKVASGEYAKESEVIRDGLRALLARDRALEHWLRTEVAAAYDLMKTAPYRGLSAGEVRAALAEEQERVASARYGVKYRVISSPESRIQLIERARVRPE